MCAFLVILKTVIMRRDAAMARTTTMTVRLSGALSDFVAANVGENGSYENVSEYVRDLIRRDKDRAEREAFEAMRLRLQDAFATPDDEYELLSANDIRRRALAGARR
jgi:antitoxin ParD1/3/4